MASLKNNESIGIFYGCRGKIYGRRNQEEYAYITYISNKVIIRLIHTM